MLGIILQNVISLVPRSEPTKFS
eukprot:SAG31_NODE_31956_length_362_cov_0.585551_1_plen_22_part_10